MQRTLYMRIAYDGTQYHGWQTQPGMRTVQDVLEQSIRRVVRHPIALIGSGRTDSGVHAAGQVASFKTTCPIPADRLIHATGSRLPDDVAVVELRDVADAFDARSCAISKLYRYRIFNATRRPVDRLVQRQTYHCWRFLDVERMRQAAGHFIGEQDFAAMTSKASRLERTVRTVLRCDVWRHKDEVRIDVEGAGFMYHQVRNMAGTLIEVGCGRWEPDRIPWILASRDRANAGAMAPALGLSLMWVRYPPHLLTPPDEKEEPWKGDTR